MEGEHRNLHSEGQEDQQEGKQLQTHRDADQWNLDAARDKVRREVLHTRGCATPIEVEQQDTNQHEYASKEGVEQEFPGRVDTPRHTMLHGFAAPDTDQEEHWGQFDFPEEEEEQQVEGQKDAHHASLQQQNQGHVFLDTDFLPATDNRQHGEQGI